MYYYLKKLPPMAEVEGHGRCLSIEDAHEIKQDQSYLMAYTYLAKGFTLKETSTE